MLTQAYRTWLETEHEWLFYVNNDVLVPDGAIDAMAQAMTAEGTAHVMLSALTATPTLGRCRKYAQHRTADQTGCAGLRKAKDVILRRCTTAPLWHSAVGVCCCKIDRVKVQFAHTGGDCDLVTPQSTVKGKGYWGEVEGLEVQLRLNASGDDFVNNPLNFRRVQVRICTSCCSLRQW